MAPVPERIHKGVDAVTVTWTQGHVGTFPARELRLACQCAQCVDEMTGRPLLDPATVPHDVSPVTIRLVGNYAIRIDWSDGHGTGIYTYEFLAAQCPCEACRAKRGMGGGGATPPPPP